MTTDGIDVDAEKAAFAEKCRSDAEFTRNAVAAVLANDETKLVFHEELSRQSQTGYPTEGMQIKSATTFSYKLKPVTERLSMSVTSGNVPGASGGGAPQMVLVGYNGDWIGLLPEAARIIAYVPMGCIITALTQALFGTKLGVILLTALLVPK